MRMAVEHAHDRRGALRGEEPSRIAVVAVAEPLARLQRAEHEVGRREADDVAGDAGRRSSSAAASTSGMTAPTPTSATAGRAGGLAERDSRPPSDLAAALLARPRSASGTAASAWSTGRVVSRKYAEVPSGRPSRDSAWSSVHSRSWPKAGSHAMQRGCSRPTDGVMIDWCAPPSGASVTPDGVPTRIDCPPA